MFKTIYRHIMQILECQFVVFVFSSANYAKVECRTRTDFFYDIYRINVTQEMPRSFLTSLLFNMSKHLNLKNTSMSSCFHLNQFIFVFFRANLA